MPGNGKHSRGVSFIDIHIHCCNVQLSSGDLIAVYDGDELNQMPCGTQPPSAVLAVGFMPSISEVEIN